MQTTDNLPVMSRETRDAYDRGLKHGMALGINACIIIADARKDAHEVAAALRNLLPQKVPSAGS